MVDDKKVFDEALKKEIEKAIFLTHSEVLKETPVQTGRLRSSIIVEKQSEDEWIIGTTVEYAPFVELDTKPHIIIPITAKALHWKVAKNDVFAKIVHHPGTKGHHMFLKGVTFFENKLKELNSI